MVENEKDDNLIKNSLSTVKFEGDGNGNEELIKLKNIDEELGGK